MKTSAIAQLAFIVVSAVAVYAFVSAAQADQRRAACTALCAMSPAYAGRNRLAPDFELPDAQGKLVKLSSFRGKTVVLNFWTRTCKPCLEEMPSIAALQKIASRRGDLAVLTVSTDEGPDEVREHLQVALEGEPNFPILFDPESDVVAGKYGTKLFPETWIIDPQGFIRARFDGKYDWTGALVLELVEQLSRPGSCPIEFLDGAARGPYAQLCEDGP
jgi:peroxiredoxin